MISSQDTMMMVVLVYLMCIGVAGTNRQKMTLCSQMGPPTAMFMAVGDLSTSKYPQLSLQGCCKRERKHIRDMCFNMCINLIVEICL